LVDKVGLEGARLQTAENSHHDAALKGHGFSHAAKAGNTIHAPQGASLLTIVLQSFDTPMKGSLPSGPVEDPAGNFYGSFEIGGSNICFQGCGTIYKLSF